MKVVHFQILLWKNKFVEETYGEIMERSSSSAAAFLK